VANASMSHASRRCRRCERQARHDGTGNERTGNENVIHIEPNARLRPPTIAEADAADRRIAALAIGTAPDIPLGAESPGRRHPTRGAIAKGLCRLNSAATGAPAG
jgi:hypothetical protein